LNSRIQNEWRKINDREWRRTDEWGNVWGRVDETSKGEVVQGAVEDLNDVERFPLPGPQDVYALLRQDHGHRPL
jgi:hypothetical protein